MSDLPPPRQPYRRVVIFHAILAAVIVLVAAISGSGATKALAVAGLYFVAATGWSWLRLRQREGKSSEHSAGEGGEGL
jgi:hypothetical protein